MSDNLDINAITAEIITSQLRSVEERLSGEFKNVWKKNFTSFKRYIVQAKARYERTKTLLYKNEAVSLAEIYVGTQLRSDRSNSSINDEEVFKLLADGAQILVSATAGAGKSFFSKVAFLKLLGSSDRIPLMIELRNLNDTGKGIIEYLANDLKSYDINVSTDIVLEWILKGRFALILDGYDELSAVAAKKVDAELMDLQRSIGSSSLLITSRPSDKLEYLTDIKVFEVMPLNKEQAIQLISCLRYDKKIKNKFLEQLKGDLFKTHQEFLSNPLLLTIMLMTYGDIAEIPTKMHVFYEHAFDVLFYKHDASKGMYRRELKTKLAIDDFKSILSSVSTSGYIRSKISFSNTELLAYIRKAKKVTGLAKVNPEKYRDDLLQSVCMLKLDGHQYTYNHRSFQEYFSALFLTNFSSDDKVALYERYLDRGAWDNALFLAFDINQALVEKEFVIPGINKLKHAMGDSPLDAMRSWFGAFQFHWINVGDRRRPHYGIVETTKLWEFLNFIERAYGGVLKGKVPRFGKLMTKASFEKEFGDRKDPLRVELKALSSDELKMLERIGVMKVTDKHIEFINLISDYLDKRKKLFSDNSIEDWL